MSCMGHERRNGDSLKRKKNHAEDSGGGEDLEKVKMSYGDGKIVIYILTK